MIRQFKKLKWIILSIYIAPLLLLVALPVISNLIQQPLPSMLVDPAAVVAQSRFTGLASNIGVLVWTATATVLLFNALFRFHSKGTDTYFWFLMFFGFFTVILMLDDFFLLHEGFSNLFSVSENLVFLSYVAVLVAGLVRFRRLIRHTDYLLLLLALMFFALAILVGFVRYEIQSYIGETRILIEAGLKLLGIVGWFGYFTRLTFKRLLSRSRILLQQKNVKQS